MENKKSNFCCIFDPKNGTSPEAMYKYLNEDTVCPWCLVAKKVSGLVKKKSNRKKES